MKTNTLTTLLSSVAAFGTLSVASADVHVMTADISGMATGGSGTGSGTITVDDATGYVHVTGSFTGMSGNITNVHLHDPGVLIALNFTGGTSGTFEGSGNLLPVDIGNILSGGTYINVHSTTFGSGEIEGDVLFDLVVVQIPLDSAQAGNGSPGAGTGTVTIDRNTGQVDITGSYAGTLADVAVGHLHGPAYYGASGPSMMGLTPTGGTTGTYSGSSVLTPVQIGHLLAGFTYINLHTSSFPGGEIRGQVEADQIGTEYCAAEASSAGTPANLAAVGSIVASDNDLVVQASGLPTGQFGYLLCSQASSQVFPVANSSGRLCLVGSTIGRFTGQIGNSGMTGAINTTVDLGALPLSPTVGAQAGDTWNFQLWFRDFSGGMPTSNFTGAVSLSFR
ncbi:MAG: hypothetical protein ACI8QC_003335 [Planctomycetota bacterium]|jgi:hypothetical protein